MATARMDGQVLVTEMAQQLNVSPHTIRRDLAEMCETGALERTHGGAVLPSKVRNITHRAREDSAAEAKAAIAQRVVDDIDDHSSIFLGIGTTCEAVARALRVRRGLMVLSNNLHVAQILSDHDDIDVTVSGGSLRAMDGGLVGPRAVQSVAGFRPDLAILGISAIETDGALTDFDAQEVAVSQAAIVAGRRCILVADAVKCRRKAPLRVADLGDLDAVYTDAPFDAARRAHCAQGGTVITLPRG